MTKSLALFVNPSLLKGTKFSTSGSASRYPFYGEKPIVIHLNYSRKVPQMKSLSFADNKPSTSGAACT